MNDRSRHLPLPELSEDAERWLSLWKTSEQVAMHFNELIVNYRLKALGAITIAAGLIGTVLLTKGDAATPTLFNLRVFKAGMSFLAVTWLAISFIDFLYYQRLLKGAVDELMRLEKLSGGAIRLSTNIERAVQWKGESEEVGTRLAWGRSLFYVLPLLAFIGAIWLACTVAPSEPPPRVPAAAGSSPPGQAPPQHGK